MSKPATAGNLGFSEAIGLDQLQERPFGRRVYLCEGQVGEERSQGVSCWRDQTVKASPLRGAQSVRVSVHGRMCRSSVCCGSVGLYLRA